MLKYSRLTGTNFRSLSFGSSLTLRLSRVLSDNSFDLGTNSSSSSESEMKIGLSKFPRVIDDTGDVAQEEGATLL